MAGVNYRKLRIAWSVGWLLFGLFMIVLWVASRYAILAADRQYAVLRHRLAQEELQLVKLSSNAEHGSKQINAQQR
jgi:hypothetical protein